MNDFRTRTRLLLGDEKLDKLARANVLVLGLGGVGGAAAEMLARAGVGKLTLVDGDRVDLTNCNRQLPALRSTVGKLKTEVVAERLRDINPEIELVLHSDFITPESAAELLASDRFDYAIDAIDSLSPKAAFILECLATQLPFVSSMGSGGRRNPEKVVTTDIGKTHHCALARAVRTKLAAAGIKHGVKVVFSDELVPPEAIERGEFRSCVGTISYLPAVFGCHAAANAINYLCEAEN